MMDKMFTKSTTFKTNMAQVSINAETATIISASQAIAQSNIRIWTGVV